MKRKDKRSDRGLWGSVWLNGSTFSEDGKPLTYLVKPHGSWSMFIVASGGVGTYIRFLGRHGHFKTNVQLFQECWVIWGNCSPALIDLE